MVKKSLYKMFVVIMTSSVRCEHLIPIFTTNKSCSSWYYSFKLNCWCYSQCTDHEATVCRTSVLPARYEQILKLRLPNSTPNGRILIEPADPSEIDFLNQVTKVGISDLPDNVFPSSKSKRVTAPYKFCYIRVWNTSKVPVTITDSQVIAKIS